MIGNDALITPPLIANNRINIPGNTGSGADCLSQSEPRVGIGSPNEWLTGWRNRSVDVEACLSQQPVCVINRHSEIGAAVLRDNSGIDRNHVACDIEYWPTAATVGGGPGGGGVLKGGRAVRGAGDEMLSTIDYRNIKIKRK